MKTKILLFTLVVALSCEERASVEPVAQNAYSYLTFQKPADLVRFAQNRNPENGRSTQAPQPNFLSFNDVFRQAVLKLEQATSESEAYQILKEYQDVVVMKDSSIQSVIGHSNVYGDFINRDRIYRTQDVFHKVIDERFLVSTTSENYGDLLLVNSVSNLDKSKYTIVEYSTDEPAGDERGRTSSVCGQTYLVDYYHNPSGCRNDRKVFIGARATMINAGFSPMGFQVFVPWLRMEVWGERRLGTLCNWVNYETELSYRNVALRILSYQNTSNDPNFTVSQRVNYDFSLPDLTMCCYHSLLLANGPTGTEVVGENWGIGTYGFVNIRVEASSRGVGASNWASINCQ